MFTCQIVNEDGFTMVMPEGELSYDVCNELKAIVKRHLDPGGVLSFNMGKVSFLDCAGVGFLVQMKNMVEKRNGSFELLHLQKNVEFVLDALTMNEFLNISKDSISQTMNGDGG